MANDVERHELVQTLFGPQETETIDLSTLVTEDFTSWTDARPTRIRSSLLGKLFESLPLPALLIRRSGLIAFANRACARFSKEYESIIRQPFFMLFPSGKFRARAVRLLEEVFLTRRPHTKALLLEMHGRQIWARMSFRSIRVGNDRAALVLVEDLTREKTKLTTAHKLNQTLRREISRRKEIEKALRESEQKCESAMKGADVYLWDWNIRSDSMVSDDRFLKMLGYAPGEIPSLSRSWIELVHPADAPILRQRIKEHLKGSLPHLDVEHRARCKSGEWKWVLSRGKVVELDAEGKPIRLLGTILDITEHKRNQERVRALAKALINAQETERRRLALDLHDEVAQQLWALRLFLDPVREDLTRSQPEMGEKIADISERIGELVEVVRSISCELRPPTLDKLGLATAIREHCDDFARRTGVKVHFFAAATEGARFDFETEINLFRLAQEALNNVRKHATARTVTVRLELWPSHIALSIEDDGRGFDLRKEVAAAPFKKKMGLWSMDQRARFLGGRLRIRSVPGRGCCVSVDVPRRWDKNESEEQDPDSRRSSCSSGGS